MQSTDVTQRQGEKQIDAKHAVSRVLCLQPFSV